MVESDVSQGILEKLIETIMDPDLLIALWWKFVIVIGVIGIIVVGGDWLGLY
jgi:hypothetical protein